MSRFTVPFREIGLDDVPRVGGKNASLGEMIRTLVPKGIRVPDGFAITVEGYRDFLSSSGHASEIRSLVSGVDPGNVADLRNRGELARQLLLSTPFPKELEREILDAYDALGGGKPIEVAVRSSATAEDLPEASFAGQQETYLNIRGHGPLLEACRRCFASLFTDRAISYRADMGFDPFGVELSIGVQRMVRSDLGSAGVIFTIDTETGFRDIVLINSSFGLGETVVQGSVIPDEIVVFKPTLRLGCRAILRRRIGSKEVKTVYDVGGHRGVRVVPVPQGERERLSLSDDEALQLARWACQIEEHYSKRAGHPTPVDLEWARDGITDELFIVQARPETVQARREIDVLETFELERRPPSPIAIGRSVGEKIAQGRARVIRRLEDLSLLRQGEILVTDKTDPDWEPAMKRAAGIVTNRGGRTAHAAIVSRELGIPAVVGAERATESIPDGDFVTISCAEGDTGRVYPGKIPFRARRLSLRGFARPRTRMMMNLADPDEALRLSFLPNDGIGLARLEFIIAESIRVHPMALAHPERVTDAAARAEIRRLTSSYRDPREYFVEKLAEGVAMIAAAFHPKDVIVRLSDFKTNEYAHLVGGAAFEPREENPMLGFRGASRYVHERYREGFALECEAIRRVRDEKGLSNVKVMIPFCRTPAEGRGVIREMRRNGLNQGENGLEVYVMCEIPSNVILAEEFAEVFDGFSIGSNDLTQLTLGVDRDSEIVAHLFDERDPAVLETIAEVIASARRTGTKIGICGQAPSDYPEFADFLIRQGIDSISLNPDVLLKTTLRVSEAEAATRKSRAG